MFGHIALLVAGLGTMALFGTRSFQRTGIRHSHSAWRVTEPCFGMVLKRSFRTAVGSAIGFLGSVAIGEVPLAYPMHKAGRIDGTLMETAFKRTQVPKSGSFA
jgi:hypothetical protein